MGRATRVFGLVGVAFVASLWACASVIGVQDYTYTADAAAEASGKDAAGHHDARADGSRSGSGSGRDAAIDATLDTGSGSDAASDAVLDAGSGPGSDAGGRGSGSGSGGVDSGSSSGTGSGSGSGGGGCTGVAGTQCLAPGAWGTCTQTASTSCVGQQSRGVGICQDGGCVSTVESQPCMLPKETVCGADHCCGPGVPGRAGCGGQCGSDFQQSRCDGAGNCVFECKYVVCWSNGCGAGTVTQVACP